MKKTIISIVAVFALIMITGEASTFIGQIISFSISYAVLVLCVRALNRMEEKEEQQQK